MLPYSIASRTSQASNALQCQQREQFYHLQPVLPCTRCTCSALFVVLNLQLVQKLEGRASADAPGDGHCDECTGVACHPNRNMIVSRLRQPVVTCAHLRACVVAMPCHDAFYKVSSCSRARATSAVFAWHLMAVDNSYVGAVEEIVTVVS
jgi:hypothetical protein